MTDNPFYVPNRPPPVPSPRPTQRLWSVLRSGEQIDAELLGHGESGWELQLYRRGEFYAGRRFNQRAQAIAYGDLVRGDLEAEGWAVKLDYGFRRFFALQTPQDLLVKL